MLMLLNLLRYPVLQEDYERQNSVEKHHSQGLHVVSDTLDTCNQKKRKSIIEIDGSVFFDVLRYDIIVILH